MTSITNPKYFEEKKREIFERARSLSEQESRDAIDELIEYEGKLADAQALSSEYEQALRELSLDKLSGKTASTLQKVAFVLHKNAEMLELNGPSRFRSHSSGGYRVSFYEEYYFFMDRHMILDALTWPFFGVEKAKLRPEQIEFLDRKCADRS